MAGEITFKGYVRPDGSVGVRNRLLIIGVDECVDGVCRAVAADCGEEAAVLINFVTCMLGGNEELVHNLTGVGKNPNIGAVLVVAMGCGSILPEDIAATIAESGKPCRTMRVMDQGGSRRAIARGKALAEELHEIMSRDRRTDAPIAKLIVGVKCGGSDASSGLASNPVAGYAADKLLEAGATVIGGEIIELIGGEKFMLERCASPAVRDKLARIIKAEEARWSVPGVETEIMSVGNSVGGLTTIEEKTLGALHKYGTHQVEDVLKFSKAGIERPVKPGFYLSEASHLCGAAGTHFAAMGAQMIMWTSGGAGFDNQIVPVVRISGNPALFTEDQDIDARGIMEGRSTCAEIGERLFARLLEVAGGAPTNIEGLAYSYSSIYQKDQRLEKYLEKCACTELAGR